MLFQTILSAVGSVASIAALVMYFKKHTKGCILWLIGLVAVLSVVTAVLSYWNHVLTNPARIHQEKQQAAIKEAQSILNEFPDHISYFNKGQNQGLIYAGHAYFEKHKDLFPDTYALIKKNLQETIDKAEENDTGGISTRLQEAAQAMFFSMKALSLDGTP